MIRDILKKLKIVNKKIDGSRGDLEDADEPETGGRCQKRTDASAGLYVRFVAFLPLYA